jgi:hypothetical protein
MKPVFSLSCCLGFVRPEPQIGEERDTRRHPSARKWLFGSDGARNTAIHWKMDGIEGKELRRTRDGIFWQTLHLADGTNVVLAISWDMNWPNCMRRALNSGCGTCYVGK